MPEIFSYSFMQKAFLAGAIIGVVCPTIGVFLVLKRLSMVGETLAHVSLTGVLLGFLFNVNPILAALGASLAAALGMEKLRSYYKTYGEIALAVFTSLGLGSAVILFNIVKSTDTNVQSLLFGSIVALNNQDLQVIWVLGLAVVLLILKFYSQLFYITFDEEGAKIAGINYKVLNYMLLIATSCIVAISMRIVGALLVSSLLVLPVAGSIVLSKSFKAAIFTANAISLLAVFTGLILSFYYDLAPGGAIIMVLIAILIFVLSAKKVAGYKLRSNVLSDRGEV